MTLYELGEEYTQQSAQIRAQILKLRPQLKTLQGDAYLQLKNRILKLYAIAGGCRATGEYVESSRKQAHTGECASLRALSQIADGRHAVYSGCGTFPLGKL